MAAINTEFLHQVASLHRASGDAVVTVREGEAHRVLHVTKGCLVAADSNVKSERLGAVLASEGRLDSALVEPLAAEARRQGRLLGDQLIADGLLTPTELAASLERQTLLRFEHAITMAGDVAVGAKTVVRPVVHHALGALVVSVFRENVAQEEVEALVANRNRSLPRVMLGPEALAALRLLPAELRICRRLAAGEELRSVMSGAESAERVLRLLGALIALELWS